jgi:hypothetical protein
LWIEGRPDCSAERENSHAIRLYERHGFIDAGPSQFGPDKRLMRLLGIRLRDGSGAVSQED